MPTYIHWTRPPVDTEILCRHDDCPIHGDKPARTPSPGPNWVSRCRTEYVMAIFAMNSGQSMYEGRYKCQITDAGFMIVPRKPGECGHRRNLPWPRRFWHWLTRQP